MCSNQWSFAGRCTATLGHNPESPCLWMRGRNKMAVDVAGVELEEFLRIFSDWTRAMRLEYLDVSVTTKTIISIDCLNVRRVLMLGHSVLFNAPCFRE